MWFFIEFIIRFNLYIYILYIHMLFQLFHCKYIYDSMLSIWILHQSHFAVRVRRAFCQSWGRGWHRQHARAGAPVFLRLFAVKKWGCIHGLPINRWWLDMIWYDFIVLIRFYHGFSIRWWFNQTKYGIVPLGTQGNIII